MRKYRMYSMVAYNLSDIQKGIQAYHATIEFLNKFGFNSEFKSWAKDEKTVIILNGGTSNSGLLISPYGLPSTKGTLNTYYQTLEDNGVRVAGFYEPDINNALTAISFLVDDRVWDREKYPNLNPKELSDEQIMEMYMLNPEFDKKTAFLKTFLPKFNLA